MKLGEGSVTSGVISCVQGCWQDNYHEDRELLTVLGNMEVTTNLNRTSWGWGRSEGLTGVHSGGLRGEELETLDNGGPFVCYNAFSDSSWALLPASWLASYCCQCHSRHCRQASLLQVGVAWLHFLQSKHLIQPHTPNPKVGGTQCFWSNPDQGVWAPLNDTSPLAALWDAF